MFSRSVMSESLHPLLSHLTTFKRLSSISTHVAILCLHSFHFIHVLIGKSPINGFLFSFFFFFLMRIDVIRSPTFISQYKFLYMEQIHWAGIFSSKVRYIWTIAFYWDQVTLYRFWIVFHTPMICELLISWSTTNRRDNQNFILILNWRQQKYLKREISW